MDDRSDGTGTSDIVWPNTGAMGCACRYGAAECSSEQMPFIKERFSTYEDFSKADLKHALW